MGRLLRMLVLLLAVFSPVYHPFPFRKTLNRTLKLQAYATFHAAMRSFHQKIITFNEFMEITQQLTEKLEAARKAEPQDQTR